MNFNPIAYIQNGFSDKFGIPRQSGLAPNIKSKIVFEKEYALEQTIRGIEQYSHLWLIWSFSENLDTQWKPTVRPPRLGGNKRVGVFATRSPFRPNSIGLSSVKLENVEISSTGISLIVSGADLLSGTPILDIKPYIKYSDSHPDAKCGFSDDYSEYKLDVVFPEDLKKDISNDQIESIKSLLSLDPRPAYQEDESREYHMDYDNLKITFSSDGKYIYVKEIIK